MPIRNPFARRPGPAVQDENQRPGSAAGTPDPAHPGFERVDTVGSKASSAFSISSRRSQDTGEYKLSVVNDSGVYLPPSPIEKEAPWPRRYLGRTSSDKSSVVSGGGDIEHFSISRESFDSYRRSFDISAKSPVVKLTDPSATAAFPARQSLDSHAHRFHLSPPIPRFLAQQQLQHPRYAQSPMPEEGAGGERDERFEDVGLNDDDGHDDGAERPAQPQQARKRGFFARFASDSPTPGAEEAAAASGGTAMSRFLPLPLSSGRRGRGPSPGGQQQGAELGAIPPAVGGDAPELLRAQEVEG